MRKIVLVITLCFVGVNFFGCSRLPQTDYFIYSVRDSKGDPADSFDKATSIWISELTEKGKQQKILEVPAYIKGIPVTTYGFGGLLMEPSIRSKELEVLILPATIQGVGNHSLGSGSPSTCPNLKEIYINTTYIIGCDSGIKEGTVVYVPSITIEDYKQGHKYALASTAKAANISFLFNYENSPNDNFYRIDNKPGGSKIVKPKVPEREGYTFGGWYKDDGCTVEWNFDFDTIPEELTEEDEEGNEITVYQETCLYAKWVLCG